MGSPCRTPSPSPTPGPEPDAPLTLPHLQDLLKDLKSELGGKFEDVILGLMMPPYEFLAYQLHKAMAGAGTDEDVLFETLCTHSNAEIRAIRDTYQKSTR